MSTKLCPVDPQKNSRVYYMRNKVNMFIQPVLEMNTATSGWVKGKKVPCAYILMSSVDWHFWVAETTELDVH